MIVSALKLFISVISLHTGFNPIYSHYYVTGALLCLQSLQLKDTAGLVSPYNTAFNIFIR